MHYTDNQTIDTCDTMIFNIDWKDREVDFVEDTPLAMMHLTSDLKERHGLFGALLPLITAGITAGKSEWQYSTRAPLMKGHNLDILGFLTEDPESVFYRVEEITKVSGDELNSFEIAFTCPSRRLSELLLNRKLSWGHGLNICGWLGFAPQNPSYKFSGWKVRPLPTEARMGFCTCNEGQGIEFFGRTRADLSFLTK